ncbi:MAG TPA: ABC transporter permease subunit [Gemmatimonadales bacterium]
MSILALLGHAWRRHRVALLVLGTAFFLFQWLFTKLAPSPSQAGAIQQLLQLLPPAFMQMFGNEIAANLNPRGALSFGWAHPFGILLAGAWVARVSAGALAGEIGGGTMDLMAARPVPRWSAVTAAVLALAAGLAFILLMGWAGTATGIAGRPSLGLNANLFLRIAAADWMLFLSFGCIGLLISAAGRSGGTVLGIVSATIGVSFALDYLARAWAPIHWTRALSLFMYYRPQRLLADGFAPGDVIPFLLTTAVASTLAFVVFAKRDL